MPRVAFLERTVLAAPDVVARSLAGRAPDARSAWMLRQPDAVRESYVREVLEALRPGPH